VAVYTRHRAVEFDPGLTAKLGITPQITLDVAVNPDFAQVEADAIVVTANQRFPIFFEEKRPFFLEGIDIFQTPLQAVHTRTIVDPDIALKLTGKHGKNTFGVMLASDNSPGNFSREERSAIGRNVLGSVFDNRLRFLDKNAYVAVVRLKRDIGKENSIGLVATSYNFIERHNDTGGIDGRFRLNKQTTLKFQVLGTTSRRLFRDLDRGGNFYRTGNGFGYAYDLESTGRNVAASCAGEGRTLNYRASLGFTRRTNSNANNCLFSYRSDPDGKARLVSWRVHNFTETSFDWQGRSQFFQNSTEMRLNFQRQSYLAVGFQKGYERVFEEEFGTRRSATRTGAFAGDDPERSAYRKNFYAYGSTTPSKKFYFFTEFNYIVGALDFDFGSAPKFPRVSPGALTNPNALQDPGPGNELVIDSQFVYQPKRALRIALNYKKDRLVRRDTGLVAFDDNIYALRTTYQFTRFLSARARVDYTTLATGLRAVPPRLDAQPRHGHVRRLQQRPDAQRLQPLHRPVRAGTQAQRSGLLHQNVVPLPAQPVSVLTARRQVTNMSIVSRVVSGSEGAAATPWPTRAPYEPAHALVLLPKPGARKRPPASQFTPCRAITSSRTPSRSFPERRASLVAQHARPGTAPAH